ncbi:WD repeat-containing protein 20-like isoform X1 [Rhopilema esculentum]|uniref:WD repeat-containing protein 20-like isoform X1 n=1 Tax=Rhopilema esculentum TaxID=499914 RepID=UPI0031DD7EFA
MAAAKNLQNEVKTQFCTKEGCYKLLQLSDYSRPLRPSSGPPNNVPVRLSFVTVKDGTECEDKIAFNIGRDMYFSNFRGIKKAPDPCHPIDRRPYKGPQPSCHDINLMTRRPDMLEILIGFTGGQIQLMDPMKHECIKCFNEEILFCLKSIVLLDQLQRLIDKGIVTCIRWIPGTDSMFLASHSTGMIYVYNKEYQCVAEPVYTVLKRGKGFVIENCKNKTLSNPICKWIVGRGAINDMVFSPDCKHIAIASEDGYLRVFDYERKELVGIMRSYFGGLLTAAWSPDGKYIVTGGEDDHVTVWSFLEQRVIVRGQGHRSWVNAVTFDPYTTNVGGGRIDDSDEEEIAKSGARHRTSTIRDHSVDSPKQAVSYRFGSVGDDTLLLLWDLSDDVLRPQRIRTRSLRTSTFIHKHQQHWTYAKNSPSWQQNDSQPSSENKRTLSESKLSHKSSSSEHKLSLKKHSFNSVSSKHQNSVSNYTPNGDEDEPALGTTVCPRFEDVPILEPLVSKKISQDRLCGLVFKEDCIITSTYDGYVHVWARPGSLVSKQDSSTVIQ